LRALHLLLPSILKGTSRFLRAQSKLLGLICREPHGIRERLNVMISQMFGGDAGTQLLKLVLREAPGLILIFELIKLFRRDIQVLHRGLARLPGRELASRELVCRELV
jgi:hypothetical protein